MHPAGPEQLYGADRFWSLSIGARIFLGGDPMRMGAYGVLDPMTTTCGPGAMDGAAPHHP